MIQNGQLKIQLKMKKTIGKYLLQIYFTINLDIYVTFSNAVVGESSLDRLACALGGKTMLNYILTTIQTMLQNRS